MLPRLTAPLAALLAACIQLPPALPPPCEPCDADSGAADAHDAAADAHEPDAHVADAPVPDADAPDDAVTPDAHEADAPDATTGPPCPFGCEAGVPVVVTALTAGDAHTCARAADGRVFCWGSLAHGAVGLGLLRQGAAPPHPVVLDGPAAGIASGAHHTCAWSANGDLACWGDDRLSQTATSSPGWRPAPAIVPLDDPVTAYVGGYHRGCALAVTGVRCWGLVLEPNTLDDPADGRHQSPTLAPHLAGVAPDALALGGQHACFVADGGAGAACFGANDRGQLGDGTTTGSVSPVAVASDALITPIHALAAGARHTCAVVGPQARQVQCWGHHGRGAAAGPHTQPVTRPTTVDHTFSAPVDGLALGDDHTCAVSGGEVVCWGDNRHSQLGAPSPAQRSAPAPVPDLAGVVAIVAGGRHTCALLSDGGVRCWGDGADGQRGVPPAEPGGGHAPNEVRYDPDLAARPPCDAPGAPLDPGDDGGATCRQCAPEGAAAGCAFRCGDAEECDPVAPGGLAAGTDHSCAALASGALFCWGDNERRQLGAGDGAPGEVLPPTRVPGLSGVAAVAAGAGHTCALRDTGAVTCWGDATKGQVGVIGATSGGTPAPPTLVAGVPPASALAARDDTTCAAAGARLWCWGVRLFAPEGPSFDKEPVEVSTVGVATIHAIALGRRHGCVLADRDSPAEVREVSCWGHNNAGQLGRESAGSVVVKPVPGVVGAALFALAATAHATCATDGERVLCWGGASTGALGPAADQPQPIDLGAHFDAEVVALAAGEGHLCAAQVDGRVRCWGAGGDGQLGLEALPEVSPTPTLVPGVGGVVALSAGGAHTCALDADGLLVCWGADGRGALGTVPWHDSPHARPAPHPVGAYAPFP